MRTLWLLFFGVVSGVLGGYLIGTHLPGAGNHMVSIREVTDVCKIPVALQDVHQRQACAP
jgi:hypothetical protein